MLLTFIATMNIMDGLFITFLVGGLCGGSIIAISVLKYLYFQFGLRVKGGLSIGGAPKMHNVSGLSQVRY